MEVAIRDEFITTAQFLKKVNLISSGGEAKHFLLEIEVFVNGQQDQRRGKKLFPGDTIEIQTKQYTIIGPTP